MGVHAFRWWRVTPEGILMSVYHDARWEQPVLTASFVPRESYEGRITRIVPYKELRGEWGHIAMPPVTNEAEKRYWERLIIEIALPTPPHPFMGTIEYDYYKEGQKVGDIVPLEDPAGIYALREETPLAGPIFWDAMASGWVSLFGHIVEHEKGYRAEKALVCGPLKLWDANAELAQLVANRYECEVETKQTEMSEWNEEALQVYEQCIRSVSHGTGQANPGV